MSVLVDSVNADANTWETLFTAGETTTIIAFTATNMTSAQHVRPRFRIGLTNPALRSGPTPCLASRLVVSSILRTQIGHVLQ